MKDMQVFQERKPDDPYRTLWLFLTSAQLDQNKAMQTLMQQYASHHNDEWVGILLRFIPVNKHRQNLFAALPIAPAVIVS